MKTAVLKKNSEIIIVEKNIPLVKPDECLIKVNSCGICSSDIYRSHDNGAYFYPLTMGHEFSGQIIKVGSEKTEMKINDRVTVFPLLPCFSCDSCIKKEFTTCSSYKYYGSRNDGGFAEYIAIKNWNLIKTNQIDPLDASLLEPLSVVVHALKKISLFNEDIKIKENHKICLIGCGFLGLMMSEILIKKFEFNEISIIDRNSFKLNKVLNARSVVKNHLVSDKEWDSYLNLNKNNFDTVIEISGNHKNFRRSLHLSKPKGRILWMGNIDNNLNLKKQEVSMILRKELKISGSWNSNYKSPDDDWKSSIDLIEKKIVLPSRFITKKISLNEFPEYMKILFNHKMRKKRQDYIKYNVVF